jgi:TolA-binding protein
LGLNRTAAARQSADQALFLQPEGRLNAEARFVSGEIYFSEADYESAARAFMSLAVLTDDPEITPRALKRGAESYRRAEKDSEADNALKELGQRFPASALNTGS